MDTNGTELNDAGYTRKSAIFDEAASPQGSVSIASNMTFGPFSSAATVFGNAMFDASSGGNMLMSGSFMTVRTLNPGHSQVVHVLNITYSSISQRRGCVRTLRLSPRRRRRRQV